MLSIQCHFYRDVMYAMPLCYKVHVMFKGVVASDLLLECHLYCKNIFKNLYLIMYEDCFLAFYVICTDSSFSLEKKRSFAFIF